MSTGSPHYLRFFVAAVFSGTLIVGDLHFSALDDVRTRLSLVLVPIRTAAELPGTMRDGTIAYLRSREALLNEKAALEAQIAEEDAHLKSLEFIRQQNSELRQLLGIRQSAPGRWLAAEVVRNVSQAGAQRVLLNRGLGDGVVLGQAVVDEAGVVGQVVRADVNTSVVGLLTAPGQWISTRVVRNNLLVLLRGDSSRRLAVEYVTNDADLREGDVLLADGGVFPPGYPVAVVDSLEDGAQFKQGGARPLFDFSDNAFALLYLPAAADNATGAGRGGQ